MEVKDPKKEESRPEGGDGWAKLREAQTQALDLKHSGMAVIIDLADAHNPNDIHPKNKQDVGGRLAQYALNQTYGKNLVASGPMYSGHKIKGNQIHVTFKEYWTGFNGWKKDKLNPTIEIKNGTLKHFSIAGDDKKWYWADAKIIENKVVISSKEVKKPVAARYAFTMNPADANLYNKEDYLPDHFVRIIGKTIPYCGTAPRCEQTLAATLQASDKISAYSFFSSKPNVIEAVKESPAPTVSTTSVLNPG